MVALRLRLGSDGGQPSCGLVFGFECEPLSTREESSEAYVEASYERLQQCLLVWENTPLPLSSDFEKLVDSATVFRNRAKQRRNRV